MYYVKGDRGLWTGFIRGFYADSRKALNRRCINDDTALDFAFLENFINGNERPLEIFNFVTTMAKVVNDNMNFCGYREAV